MQAGYDKECGKNDDENEEGQRKTCKASEGEELQRRTKDEGGYEESMPSERVRGLLQYVPVVKTAARVDPHTRNSSVLP